MALSFAQLGGFAIIPGAFLYLYIVRRLRFSRANKLPIELGYADQSTFGRMTVEDAFKTHNELVEYEFPTTFSAASTFALFKAYGIPTISSVLCSTGQFSSKITVDKRYADTGCLLKEAVLNPPGSARAIEALARVNYLHSAHRASGRITDEDMLYTLSLFVLEPARWIARYEWRALTDFERCAVATLWKSTGSALGVKYDLLPGSQDGWRDGLQWLNELDTWSCRYQDAHMVPNATNKKVADATLYHILYAAPASLKAVGFNIITVLLEEQLRVAMMFPKPSQSYYTFLRRFVAVRKFFLLHLSLPRRKPKRRQAIVDSSGRMQAIKYTISPWYVKPTLKNRWGLGAWKIWMKGGILPGDDGDKYFPDGFVASELGPTALRGYGKEKMELDKKRLEAAMNSETGRCPFFGVHG